MQCAGSVDGDCLIRNTNDFEKAIQPNVMVTCHMRKDAIQVNIAPPSSSLSLISAPRHKITPF